MMNTMHINGRFRLRLTALAGWAIVLATLFTSASCHKYAYVDCETYDYSDCIEDEPFSGNMEIKVSISAAQAAVPVAIYEGRFPGTVLVLRDTLITAVRNITLEAGKRYTITAEYHRDGKTITAVDGDEITKKAYDVCDAVCWDVRDGKVDLRLAD